MRSLLLLMLTIPLFVSAQKVIEDKTDEFTKHQIKRTSWDRIVFGNSFVAHSQVSKVDNTVFLNLKIMRSGVFAVEDGGKLMLMVATDSALTLTNQKYQISCRGCGAVGLSGSDAQGIDLSFTVSPDVMTYLAGHSLKKIRLYTTSGYLEAEIKSKNSSVLSSQLKLMN
jgi:hypothetical protein